ncbi:hypothetical protein O6H91_16G016900 [Diphasiastrum complanatum]|uniref:Uncharacterized protein n=1 Tax=Diphasiastrum complanatum TaxID=34168 RepID=A0ACC2BA23_DIPCM|nr:hypothetical protein O6H91_16G016900 [Diphasiastrum complanatum]
MTIELQNGIVQTTSQEKVVNLHVLPEPLQNEAGRYSNPSINSILSPTSAESVILASGGVGDQPPISTSVTESPTDFSSNSAADSSDLSHEKLPGIYFDNVVSVESSQPIDNSYSEQLPRINPDNVISFESNEAIDSSHNEQLPLTHADSVLLLKSHEEKDVSHKVQDPSQQPNDIEPGTIHPPENETSVRSDNESSRHEPSPSKSDSNKELTAEGLPQVPPATGVAKAEEIRSEQELISSDPQNPVSELNRKVTPSENCSNDSPYKPSNSFGCDKPINKLEEAEDVEQLEQQSPKSLHTSPDELLKTRTESVSRSSKRGTKLFTDKPIKQFSEANRGQSDRASEQSSRPTQNGNVEKKSSKKSPDKPPRSSPSKPPKPVAAGSTDKKEAVQKCTVTEKVFQKQPCSSPDKRAKGSVEKVAKQRQSPVRNKHVGSNGSGQIDWKLGGSPNGANMFDKDVRPRSGSPSVSPFIFKLAKSCKAPADNPFKALDYALQSVKFFERSLNESHSLELVKSLHVLAAVYCRLGQYEEAIAVLERSLALSEANSHLEYALSSFSGYMQLGDTFSLLGRHETSVDAYHAALKLQKQALGELDPRVGDTCRYLAEAHLQVLASMNFVEF